MRGWGDTIVQFRGAFMNQALYGGASPPPPPTPRQRLFPGSLFPAYINETDSNERLIPGAGYVNETIA